MAKKVQSDWLDNSKLRKPLYEFNQAVKLVYTEYRFIDGLVIPLCMKSIKNPTLFKKSIFHWRGKIWEFLNNCAIDPEGLNKALKNKGYIHRVDETEHYLRSTKDDEEYFISTELSDVQIEDSGSYIGMTELIRVRANECIGSYVLSDKDVKMLLEYQSLERVVALDGDVEVKMIMLKEIFPMLKKASDITVSVYQTSMDNVYDIVIESVSEYWTFTSIHSIVNY
jgi:hypothetical protein